MAGLFSFMRHKKKLKKQFFAISRWLHIYVAMTFFVLLLFFCITGITLNHTNWFEDADNSHNHTFTLPDDVLQDLHAKETPDTTSTQAFLARKASLTKPRSIDIDLEAGEISFDYPLPAGYAFVIVSLASGTVEIEHKTGTLIMLLNDLHKGRHTGAVWSWVIDISAAAIAIFSLTGLIILLQHSKKRSAGLILAVAGFVLPILIYFLGVPFLSIH